MILPVCFHVERFGPRRYTTLVRSIASEVVKLCGKLTAPVTALEASLPLARQNMVTLIGRSVFGVKVVCPCPAVTDPLATSDANVDVVDTSNL